MARLRERGFGRARLREGEAPAEPGPVSGKGLAAGTLLLSDKPPIRCCFLPAASALPLTFCVNFTMECHGWKPLRRQRRLGRSLALPNQPPDAPSQKASWNPTGHPVDPVNPVKTPPLIRPQITGLFRFAPPL